MFNLISFFISLVFTLADCLFYYIWARLIKSTKGRLKNIESLWKTKFKSLPIKFIVKA